MSKTGYWLIVFTCIGVHIRQCMIDHENGKGIVTTMPDDSEVVDTFTLPKHPKYYSLKPFKDKEADSLEQLYNRDNIEYKPGEGQWDDDDSWTGYFN